jgi:hypothetical protein
MPTLHTATALGKRNNTPRSLARLVLTSLPDLSLESTLDGVDTSSTSTRLAGHEEDTIFFCQECVGRFAGFARHVFD